jgi:hypothetical protein
MAIHPPKAAPNPLLMSVFVTAVGAAMVYFRPAARLASNRA